jgi:hypothetical protein
MGEMLEKPGKNNSRIDACPREIGWSGEVIFSLAISVTSKRRSYDNEAIYVVTAGVILG